MSGLPNQPRSTQSVTTQTSRNDLNISSQETSSKNNEHYFDPIDIPYIRGLLNNVLGDIIDHYFRAVLINEEQIPNTGPVILASNHSGNAFPHDGIILNGLLWRKSLEDGTSFIRSMYSPKLARSWWMRAFTIDDFWRRCGAVDQTFANFNHLLKNNERLIYYPEGVPGIGKGFNRKYQLQHYYSSFVVLSAWHNTPVIPIYTINAEWVNPANITFKWLDRLFDKLIGIPFFPLPNVFFAFLFPFILYLSFPAHMVYKIGEPLDIRAMLKEEGCADVTRPDRETALRVADKVRRIMQPELNKAVTEYGERPFDLKSLRTHLKKCRGFRKRILPTGWPGAFLRHFRDRERPKARNRVHRVLRDWDLIFFYLPLGWFGLSLCRRFRKPPYGYRGLTRDEQKVREGAYFWSLDERPLPPKS